jgi:hypothetical protein
MEYLFRKDGTEYTRFTINEVADYIDRHGLEGLLKILKDLDYPYFEEEWNRQVSSTEDTCSALTRYFNHLNLIAYRKFRWKDTEDKFKEKLISPEAKRIKETLDVVSISKKDYNTLVKDRLDFGFDSIYFRYSEAIEELSYYKEREAHKECTHFDRKHWADGHKMHFYGALEQLLQAHKEEKND